MEDESILSKCIRGWVDRCKVCRSETGCVWASEIVSVKVRDVRFYGVFVCEDKWDCECLSERCDML